MEKFRPTEMGEHFSTLGKNLKLAASGAHRPFPAGLIDAASGSVATARPRARNRSLMSGTRCTAAYASWTRSAA
jgi:hypothetical protein